MTDRCTVEFFTLQSTLEGALDTTRAPASEFRETKPLNVVNHRNEQTVFDGDHQADVRTARLDQTSIGRAWISRKSRVHGRIIAECSSDCLQQEIVHRQLARAAACGNLRTQRLQQGPVDRAFDEELRDGRIAQRHRARQCTAHRGHPLRRRPRYGRSSLFMAFRSHVSHLRVERVRAARIPQCRRDRGRARRPPCVRPANFGCDLRRAVRV